MPIAPATLQAYRETDYLVHAEPAFTLHVDLPSPQLAAWHEARAVTCSAYVTACNPQGRRLGDARNDQRHAALGRELQLLGLPVVPGIGLHPGGQWPGEASWLVAGLDLVGARTLGARWAQNAILWAGADARPRLVLLR